MIRLIAALDVRRGIAKGGVQPWYIPEDEAYFREQTMGYGGVVLMGKTTFDVIGRPLPDRQNYVLSREMHHGEGVMYVLDLDQIVEQKPDIWIIGGAQVFAQTLALADELYITHIEADFGCDQFFPEYEHAFELQQTSELHTQNGFIFTYNVYRKL